MTKIIYAIKLIKYTIKSQKIINKYTKMQAISVIFTSIISDNLGKKK